MRFPKPSTEGKRVAIYARISTDSTRQNLDNQLLELRAYCQRQKWKITAEYTDQASGGSLKRPGLDACLRDASRKEFDYVLVFDLSRLTRGGPSTAFAVVERLKLSGVELWSFHEEYFRTPYVGDVMLAVAAFIAQQERETMSARTKAGIERARKDGKHVGRPIKHVDGQELLRLRAAGLSYRELAVHFQASRGTIERRIGEARRDEIERRRAGREALKQ